MDIMELFKVILLGVIEGITEWLPISSTGHMILADEWIRMDITPAFKEMFLVVIQLGAILAVVALYFRRLFPFRFGEKPVVQKGILTLWLKILAACVPAAVIGLLFDDALNDLFYNEKTVAVSLIVFGILFLVVERYNRNRAPVTDSLDSISYRAALFIGLFQVIAAVFPGVSRSGATIIGALLIGISRRAAAEFTFFLAVPVMFGASLLKLAKFGPHFTQQEGIALLTGTAVAFLVSIAAIRFLLGYIKKHDFTVFGWYRIALGCFVLVYFALAR